MKASEPYFNDGLIRLYLGDCREIVHKVDIPADAGWIIDPPWDSGIVVTPGFNKLVFCDGKRQHDVISLYGPPIWIFVWDCITSWYTGRHRPLKRAKFAFWYGAIAEYEIAGGLIPTAEDRKCKTVSNPRSTYTFTPNSNGKHLSDIFRFAITKNRRGQTHDKPVVWMSALIGNCFGKSPVIVDPFVGGGSAAIACLELGRPYIGVEIDQQELDRTIAEIERWKRTPSLFKQKANKPLQPTQTTARLS